MSNSCSSGLCSLPTALLPQHQRLNAHLKTPLSSSWSLQTTPHWSASFRTVTSLLTDKRLRSWLSGAVLTTWSWTRSKLWRWSWTSGETPLLSPHYHHHEQHCDCSGDIQVPGIHHLSRPDLGHSHQFHCKKKSPTKFVLPSPAQEVHPAIWAAETVLLSRHRVSSVHINNCLVWLSYKYKIRHQKTTENGSHCWTDYRCPPAHTPRTVYTQSEEKGSENHSGSRTSKSSPFLTFTIWPALQSHN